MKSIKRNLAVLLAVLLVIPTLTAAAQTDPASTGGQKTVETSVEEAAPPKGGFTEGGSTEGGSTESGSTESGSTEGGSTESGSTENGSTESGSTEGGSTESGSTEGGSTEDGSTEGGSTESGSMEGGSTEGGSTESGSTEDGLTGEDPDLAESKEKETEEAETEEESKTKETRTEPSEEVLFNTGSCVFSVVGKEDFLDYELGDAYFEDDGSYTINIPEENPFFPYEVQFTYDGSTTNRWFMTPDDSVEVGGHRFYVSAYFDGTAVTQLSLRVGGDKVTVYPEKKEFTDGDGISEASLQPLEERRLTADLSAYTPAELTMVSTDAVLGNAAASGDKVAWTYRGEGDYTVSGSGDRLDLSYNTYYTDTQIWEMIVGEGDQLAASDIRYLVTLEIKASGEWLIPTVYWQEKDNPQNRIEAAVTRNNYYDYDTSNRWWRIYVGQKEASDAFISFEINPSFVENKRFDHFSVYQGQYQDVAAAETGVNITSQICCSDMSQPDAGYEWSFGGGWVTIVTYDASGHATGCLPFDITLEGANHYIYVRDLFKRENGIRTYVVDSGTNRSAYKSEGENVVYNCTLTLYKEYASDDTYYLTMNYYWGANAESSAVTAAYEGHYKSIAEAASAGASDIKDALFGTDYNTQGYAADYSGGVPFTIFVGEDSSTEQEAYYYTVKAVTGTNSADRPSSSTNLQFLGLKDGSKADVPCYIARMEDDSYAERNYITILVDAGTDLTRLAPVYSISDGAKLYASGSSTPEKSGESFHDFSKEPIHYTVSAEDEANERSYWLKVVPGVNGKGQLYINSLEDERSDTKIVDGVIYSTREMMLDAYHDYVHDIWMANMGTDPIPALSVTLESSTVELDEYWTLSGNHDLSGFSATDQATDDGKMSNLAKVRIRAKDGVDAGTEITGTLTVKSKDTTLMVLNLTGTVGNPRITTDNIPQAVKYVPYGTMIQNNNKYSWNKVSYSLTSGSLPAGMTVKKNGEIYGVPTETGTFTFTVRMDNSFYDFGSDTKTYTLEVIENTDANVDGATDQGYDLTQRVQNVDLGQLGGQEPSEGDRTLISNGEFAEFVDIYLDGNKLEKGTDYTAEEGSTRITIRSQTLANTSMARGTHTLGIEFRVKDTDTLKRAAQNYTIKDQDAEGGNNQGGSGSDQGGSGNDSGSGGNDGGGSGDGNVSGGGGSPAGKSTVEKGNNSSIETGEGNNEGIANPPETGEMEYIVQAGDSLWKIAEQFYGSGMYWQKIYERNTAIIRDPDKLQVGWKLLIPSAQPEEEGTAEVNGTYYTVETGDTLWSISKKFYGVGWRWRRIYHANDSISEPGSIYEGQVIVIPK